METEDLAILERLRIVLKRTFRLADNVAIGRATTAADVDGWDSLSHALLIMDVEREFGLTLPTNEAFALGNVGDLADLISRNVSGS